MWCPLVALLAWGGGQGDGTTFLVERIWPRAVKKENPKESHAWQPRIVPGAYPRCRFLHLA